MGFPGRKMPRWTDEEESLLLELAAKGYSAKQISKHLPERSAIAVGNKALHLGVKLLKRGELTPTMVKILVTLKERGHPMSKPQLAAELGVSLATLWRLFERMKADPKRVYITHYERNQQGPAIPFYMIGDKKDAKPLKKLTPKELLQRYVSRRVEEDPLFWARRYAQRKQVKKADPAAAWLKAPTEIADDEATGEGVSDGSQSAERGVHTLGVDVRSQVLPEGP